MISKRVDWIHVYQGRTGMWHLQSTRGGSSFLDFIVPNETDDEKITQVHVQISYSGVDGPPILEAQVLPFRGRGRYASFSPFRQHEFARLPLGWRQYSFHFRFEGCSRFEAIQVYPQKTGRCI
jgi:hypothetical protein